MLDEDFTPEYLEQIKNNLQACRDWLHQTLEQPYTVEEMTSKLEYYLNEHLRYYSNKPGQVPEKQQRIFKIDDRLKGDLFRRTQDFYVALPATADKAGMIRAEIARYEHPYLYHMEGIYFRPTAISIVIPHVIDTLTESHSPYFEFFFDDDLNPKDPAYFDFFSDVYFLEFLRRELTKWEHNNYVEEKPIPKPKGNKMKVETFEQLFWVAENANITVRVMKRLHLIEDAEETFINAPKNKKTMVVLIDFLGRGWKGKIKNVNDVTLAYLLKMRFNLSITARFLREHQKDTKDIRNEIERVWAEESIKSGSK